jgi:hypothetical protein
MNLTCTNKGTNGLSAAIEEQKIVIAIVLSLLEYRARRPGDYDDTAPSSGAPSGGLNGLHRGVVTEFTRGEINHDAVRPLDRPGERDTQCRDGRDIELFGNLDDGAALYSPQPDA